MNFTKENAINKYCDDIANSWTWERLTPMEKVTWLNLVQCIEFKGTAKQRYEEAGHTYTAFLYGCGYDGFNWRENDLTASK